MVVQGRWGDFMRIDIVKRLCFLFCFFIFGVSIGAQAQSLPNLTILTEHWPPKNYLDKDGNLVGEATEKVHKLMAKADINYQIVLYPWARAYHLAKNQPNTAIFSIMRSDKREPFFQWICPLVPSESLYFVKLSSRKDIVLRSIHDARAYVVAASRDEFDEQFLLTNGFIEGKHYELTEGDVINIKLLMEGHADLMIGNTESILNNLKKLNIDPKVLTMEMDLNTQKSNPLCIAFSLSTDKRIVERVKSALVAIDTKKPAVH